MSQLKVSPARILVVEDEVKTADLVALYLRHAGHRVFVEHSGTAGLKRVESDDFDAFVLDVMLPGMDGLELCRRIRSLSNAPVLFLTARSLEDQRLEGFELGADDYVTKPFSLRELVARVEALLRRRPPDRSHVVKAGQLTVDVDAHRAWVGGTPLQLTPSEFAILLALLERPGRALSREQLLARIPRSRSDPLDRIVDVHIRNLRRKIEPLVGLPSPIETVRGVGYRCSA